MTTHPIEIEGLPPGWEVTKIRVVNPTARREFPDPPDYIAIVTVAETKSKQRRIVLEETEEDNIKNVGGYVTQWFGSFGVFSEPKIWRIKEE